MRQKLEVSAGLMGYLACMHSLPVNHEMKHTENKASHKKKNKAICIACQQQEA